jgi:hypothetical protein
MSTKIICKLDRIHPNESNYMRSGSYECSLVSYEHSKISESKVITSFFSHGISFAEDINDYMSKDTPLAFKSTRNFMIGLLWILISVTSRSTIAPLTLSLSAGNPFVASSWRTQASLPFILPLMIYTYMTNNNMSVRDDFQPNKLWRSFVTSFFAMGWWMGLIIGCSMTVTSHAHILFSSTGVYILIFSLITLKVVHKYEIVGYCIFIVGVFVTLTDPLAKKHGENDHALLGCLIAFIGGGFGSVVGILSQKN